MTQEQTKTEQPTVIIDALLKARDALIAWNSMGLGDDVAGELNRLYEQSPEMLAITEALDAAPELYIALKNLVARYGESEINAAIAALAKANGR